MKQFKCLISFLMCLLMIFSAIFYGCKCSIVVNAIKSQEMNESEISIKTGDNIFYGSYPQSEVKDEPTISALNALIENEAWVSYNYYIGDGNASNGQMAPSNYMRYCDVKLNGEKYRAVSFDSYRPTSTGFVSDPEYSYQDDNGYTPNNIYWFRFEPVEWIILDSQEKILLCASIIDSQPINNYLNKYYGNVEQTHWAADYTQSNIRVWLNNDFYNTAFNEDEKNNIIESTLDNTSEPYFSNASSTTDKVFLISCSETLNNNYGFNADSCYCDKGRMRKGSDYAKCQGLCVYSSTTNDYDGNSWWWTRTPEDTTYVWTINNMGSGASYARASNTFTGVVPALRINTFNISTITFDANEGNCFITSEQVVNGRPVGELPIPQKIGYVFEGWFTSNSFSTAFTAESIINNDIIVFAKWSKCNHLQSYNKPTCEKSVNCSICGAYMSAIGHDIIHHDGKLSTCKEKGYIEYDTCSRCNYTTYCELPLAEHTPSETVTENEVIATCLSDGSYEKVVYCSRCNDELLRQTVIVQKTGHKDLDNDGICDTCTTVYDEEKHNSFLMSKIQLVIPDTTYVEYGASVIVIAKAIEVPSGYYVALYDGDKLLSKGDNYQVIYKFPDEFKATKMLTVNIIDEDENIQKDSNGNIISSSFEIKVKSSFFAKLIAVFKRLFKILPAIIVEPK